MKQKITNDLLNKMFETQGVTLDKVKNNEIGENYILGARKMKNHLENGLPDI